VPRRVGKVAVSSIAPDCQLKEVRSRKLTFVEAYACDMMNEVECQLGERCLG